MSSALAQPLRLMLRDQKKSSMWTTAMPLSLCRFPYLDERCGTRRCPRHCEC